MVSYYGTYFQMTDDVSDYMYIQPEKNPMGQTLREDAHGFDAPVYKGGLDDSYKRRPGC